MGNKEVIPHSPSFQNTQGLKFGHARFRQYKIQWQWDCDNRFAFKQSAIGLSTDWSRFAIGDSPLPSPDSLQHSAIRAE